MRLALKLVALAALVSLALVMAVEWRLPGPFGQSLTVLYSGFRVAVRDLLVSSPPSIAAVRNRGPNAIVILLDCFRDDYLERDSPHLAAFAADNWRFTRHYAAAPWTKPSTASLFTGLYPRRHGVNRGGSQRLAQPAVTLAERLAAAGFTTAGFVQGVHLKRVQAFDQGFTHYVEDAGRGSKGLLRHFFSWLARERPTRFFAYLHFPGTHDAYYYDNDLTALLTAPPYEGAVDFATIDYKHAVGSGELELTADQVAHLEWTARAKARRVDRQAVGEFLRRFLASDLAENTLLIFTSDHGDGFYEHRLVSHGFSVYNEELHVPMVMRLPPAAAAERGLAAAGTFACPSSTVDVAPTVMDFLGLPTVDDVDGVSLLAEMQTDGGGCQRPVIGELAGGGRIDAAALVRGEDKVIVRYAGESPRLELYDVASDPWEQVDLAAARPQAAAELADLLAEILNGDGSSLATWPEDAGDPISEELRQQMRTLGYVD